MKRTFSTILPVVVGVVSAALIAWDIHNQRIIAFTGMAWDTGAPLWPYQTPDKYKPTFCDKQSLKVDYVLRQIR